MGWGWVKRYISPTLKKLLCTPEHCFTNVSLSLQNNLAEIHNARNHIYGENFNLKLCTCAQSMALGSRTNFSLKFSSVEFLQYTHFERISWRAHETLVKHPPCNYLYTKITFAYTLEVKNPQKNTKQKTQPLMYNPSRADTGTFEEK